MIEQTMMASALVLANGSQIPESLRPADFSMDVRCLQKNFVGTKRITESECAALPRQSLPAKSTDVRQQNDVKKQKKESAIEGAEEIFRDEEHDRKEAYIHVRAKRGKATSSHSLAERVRREKISERMRILQDLVPGCSKITGKAVMLDEIINYVQSLQQQVEFLSMKLAAVNPVLNFGIEQNFSKAARDRIPPFISLSPIFSTPYAHYHGSVQIPSEMMMAQIENIWDEELQNAFHMTQ